MNLTEILTDHVRRYPLMQPCDAVKLIYQNEFGGGHLIKDDKISLRRIEDEYRTVAHDPTAPLYEDIGNGLVRVNLAAINTNEYSLRQLNDVFVRSAETHNGSAKSFAEKLHTAEKSFAEFGFAFSPAAFDEYLEKYREAGCPAVSHSETYRICYHPAYRVVSLKIFRESIKI